MGMECCYRHPGRRRRSVKCLVQQATEGIHAGTCTAVMGSSGSGKTSLLKVLAGDRASKDVLIHCDALSVAISGEGNQLDFKGELTDNQLNRLRYHVGYVPQVDIMIPTLTVRDMLTYGAQLRSRAGRGDQEDEEDRVVLVDELLGVLQLKSCADTLIGGGASGVLMGGISGGQLKRLGIGLELLSNPAFLVLDEPLSGLDAIMAHEVLQVLRFLCDEKGLGVICSVHQPSMDDFVLFDRVMTLGRNGVVVYEGEVAKTRGGDIVDHFTRLGYRSLCPELNPAEFMMDVLGQYQGHGEEANLGCLSLAVARGGGAVDGFVGAYAPVVMVEEDPKLKSKLVEGEMHETSFFVNSFRESACFVTSVEYHKRRLRLAMDGDGDAYLRETPEMWMISRERSMNSPSVENRAKESATESQTSLEIANPVCSNAAAEKTPSKTKQQRSTVHGFKSKPVYMNRETESGYSCFRRVMFELRVLCRRRLRSEWNDKAFFLGCIIKYGGLALLLGSVFHNVTSNIKGFRELFTLCYATVAALSLAYYDFFPRFLRSRPLFVRETRSDCYKPVSYYLSVVFVDTSLRFVFTLLFALVAYLPINYRMSFLNFLFFYVVIFVYFDVVVAFSYLASVVLDTNGSVNAVLTLLKVLGIMFAGYGVYAQDLPVYWLWFFWTSHFRYALQALLGSYIRGQWFGKCTPEEITAVLGLDGEKICIPKPDDDPLNSTGLFENFEVSGTAILNELWYGLDEAYCLAVLLFFCLSLHAITIVVLSKRSFVL
eukprot:Nk52_evm10s283 gene=Nk52_evmTU10s283